MLKFLFNMYAKVINFPSLLHLRAMHIELNIITAHN